MSFWDFLKIKKKKVRSQPLPIFINQPSVQLRFSNYYYTWNKGDSIELTPNFHTYEFDCACDSRSCRIQRISVEMVKRLQYLRDTLDFPLGINSGYRCRTYQEKLRKKGYKTAKRTSQHSLGKAVDVGILGGLLVPKRMKRFLTEAQEVFEAIGIGSKFLHLDLREGKKRRWYY